MASPAAASPKHAHPPMPIGTALAGEKLARVTGRDTTHAHIAYKKGRHMTGDKSWGLFV